METITPTRTWMGAGIGYRSCYREQLLAKDKLDLPLLEIIPQHFYADPPAIDKLAERYPLVFHDTDLPLATLGEDNRFFRARLKRIESLAERAKPFLISAHLALTSAPNGCQIGHLAPLWFTETLLQRVSDRVNEVQDRLQLPIALENFAGFTIPNAEMTEAQFFTRLVEKTQCGMLLDVSNVLINARNQKTCAKQELLQYPLAATLQVHLSGGLLSKGQWIDSHSKAVEDDSYALLSLLRGKATIRAIVVERDQEYPALADLIAEAHRASELWKQT